VGSAENSSLAQSAPSACNFGWKVNYLAGDRSETRSASRGNLVPMSVNQNLSTGTLSPAGFRKISAANVYNEARASNNHSGHFESTTVVKPREAKEASRGHPSHALDDSFSGSCGPCRNDSAVGVAVNSTKQRPVRSDQ